MRGQVPIRSFTHGPRRSARSLQASFERPSPKPTLEHREGFGCWCLPTVEHYQNADVVIHNDPRVKGGES